MISCTICPRTALDGQHLCQLHADELYGWLTELPGQARLLREFIEPGARHSQGRPGPAGRADAPVPVDLRVLTLLGPGHPRPPASPYEEAGGTVPIYALLDGWAGHIAYTYPAVYLDPHGTIHTQPCEAAHPRHGATITGWCAWLTAYLPYALTHPWVGDLHRQLGDLLATIRDLTHAVPHHHPKTAPCPRCEAFRLVAVDGQEGISCSACGHRLTVAEYDQHTADFLDARQAPPDSTTTAA